MKNKFILLFVMFILVTPLVFADSAYRTADSWTPGDPHQFNVYLSGVEDPVIYTFNEERGLYVNTADGTAPGDGTWNWITTNDQIDRVTVTISILPPIFLPAWENPNSQPVSDLTPEPILTARIIGGQQIAAQVAEPTPPMTTPSFMDTYLNTIRDEGDWSIWEVYCIAGYGCGADENYEARAALYQQLFPDEEYPRYDNAAQNEKLLQAIKDGAEGFGLQTNLYYDESTGEIWRKEGDTWQHYNLETAHWEEGTPSQELLSPPQVQPPGPPEIVVGGVEVLPIGHVVEIGDYIYTYEGNGKWKKEHKSGTEEDTIVSESDIPWGDISIDVGNYRYFPLGNGMWQAEYIGPGAAGDILTEVTDMLVYNFPSSTVTYEGDHGEYRYQNGKFEKKENGNWVEVENPERDIPDEVKDHLLSEALNQEKEMKAARKEAISRIWGQIFNPTMGAYEIGQQLEEWIFGEDVSIVDPRKWDLFGFKPFAAAAAGWETYWCEKKHISPSEYFTQDYAGHFISGGPIPSLNSTMFYVLGKRTEFIESEYLDWDTDYRVDDEKPKWFPNITSPGNPNLIYSLTNPSLSAMGYIYKLSWLVRHPYTQEQVDGWDINRRRNNGLDDDGNVTFRIEIKEAGTPLMTQLGFQRSPQFRVPPGGQISKIVVRYKLPYLTEICIKFENNFKWHVDGYSEYPPNCVSPDGNMGMIVKQELEASPNYEYISPPTTTQPGDGSSDWDWG